MKVVPLARAGSKDRNHLIAAVAGTFDIVEIFGQHATPLTYREVVELSGKPRGSVHRILSTLVVLGVLKQGERLEYSLTFKLWGLGKSAFAGLDMVSVAMPHIQQLVAATNETAHLGILDGPECVTYLSKFESQQSIKVQYWVGKRVHSWRSATGRSMLAYLPESVEGLRRLTRPPPDLTSAALRSLDDELRKVRVQGYAVAKGENHPEMGGIAAPVRDHSGCVIAACGIAMPAYRMTRAVISQACPHVLQAALAISSELGYGEETSSEPINGRRRASGT